ncbi:AbrB/MazE/SpoVT family DNA-binding domain-containing protein [Sulfolobus tengchongensis]|uniref:AbrB/MazE/SpoVT family DNA-binding domain-containing protein n=1 Tax=Sulfolobus tengchongensis TaxID=207809 RepID=A0AAX4L4C4_9CREN
MKRVKVTKNYKVTIPASIREKIGLKEGDVLEVYLNGEEIVFRKVKTTRPRKKLNEKLTVEKVEVYIEDGSSENSG